MIWLLSLLSILQRIRNTYWTWASHNTKISYEIMSTSGEKKEKKTYIKNWSSKWTNHFHTLITPSRDDETRKHWDGVRHIVMSVMVSRWPAGDSLGPGTSSVLSVITCRSASLCKSFFSKTWLCSWMIRVPSTKRSLKQKIHNKYRSKLI